MNKNYLILLILVISPFVLMLLHVVFIRMQNILKINISRQLSVILIELFLNIPILLVIYFLNKDISSVIYAFIVYNSLGYSYFHFFNMSETARRIKILVEINKRKSLLFDDLSEFYKTDSMISIRLDRLIKLGQIKKNYDEKYILSSRIIWISAIIINFLRKIYGFTLVSDNYQILENKNAQ